MIKLPFFIFFAIMIIFGIAVLTFYYKESQKLGKTVCITEGGKWSITAKEYQPNCCAGLKAITKDRIDWYCTKCGDGVCRKPEDEENCLVDCKV